jgi:amidophosphoribosyltransferase
LAARKAIAALEGRDTEEVQAYLDESSPQYQAMVDWIQRDLNVTTLRYQGLEDMVQAIGLPRERLCLYCWNGRS